MRERRLRSGVVHAVEEAGYETTEWAELLEFLVGSG